MGKIVLFCVLLVGSTAAASNSVSQGEFAVGTDAPIRYLVYQPPNTGGRKLPLVVYLHGFSLRGNDFDKLKTYGPPKLIAEGYDFPAVVVCPHLGERWFWPPVTMEAFVGAMIERYPVDVNRVSLTGVSLGASGIWELASRSPVRYSAILPVAGKPTKEHAKRLTGMPIRAYHGTRDRTVSPEPVKQAVEIIHGAGGSAELILFPNAGHGHFTDEVYAEEATWRWLISHKRPPSFLNQLEQFFDSLLQQLEDWIKGLTQFAHRRSGTELGRQAEKWVAAQFRSHGLEDVQFDEIKVAVRDVKRHSLSINGQAIQSHPILNAGLANKPIVGPMVYVGKGRPSDFRRVNAKGKLVVADATFSFNRHPQRLDKKLFYHDPVGHFKKGLHHVAYPSNNLGAFLPGSDPNEKTSAISKLIGGVGRSIDAYQNAKKAGAAGFLMLMEDHTSDDPSLYVPYDGQFKALPGMYISRAESAKVRRAAQAGQTANLTIAGSDNNSIMRNVWGILPGSSERIVIITSHHDSPYKGAVEDASGIAQVLGQLKLWSSRPRSERPKTIVFASMAGHFIKGRGSHEFGKRHPTLLDKTDCGNSQET
ncbi:MAG: dienelactone hydrolase family protein [Planctomycetota bacterium]